MKFKDKVVWITGASSGIGENLAYAFAESGAKLILSSRKENELQRVKERCSSNGEIMILPMDVAEYDSLQGKTEEVIKQFGKIDILVNNAGISQRELVKDTDFSVDQKIIAVNYLGTVGLTKCVLPHMTQQKSGQLVVISSVMGKLGMSHRSAYAASKHALHGYFDSLRSEVAPDNIKVSIICPGYVQTNVTINALRGDGTKNNVMAPTTKNGMPADVFAKKALNIIARGKEEVFVVGMKEWSALFMKRFFPGIFSKIAKNIKPA